MTRLEKIGIVILFSVFPLYVASTIGCKCVEDRVEDSLSSTAESKLDAIYSKLDMVYQKGLEIPVNGWKVAQDGPVSKSDLIDAQVQLHQRLEKVEEALEANAKTQGIQLEWFTDLWNWRNKANDWMGMDKEPPTAANELLQPEGVPMPPPPLAVIPKTMGEVEKAAKELGISKLDLMMRVIESPEYRRGIDSLNEKTEALVDKLKQEAEELGVDPDRALRNLTDRKRYVYGKEVIRLLPSDVERLEIGGFEKVMDENGDVLFKRLKEDAE